MYKKIHAYKNVLHKKSIVEKIKLRALNEAIEKNRAPEI